VFPARYELNSYIVFRKRLVSKRLRNTKIIYSVHKTAHRSRSEPVVSRPDDGIIWRSALISNRRMFSMK
jgi:hypothetical protein